MRKILILIFELTIVLLVSYLTFLPQMRTNTIHTDESYWISTSKYFEDWISVDVHSNSWNINYMTLSGPNLPKYLIALARLIGGYKPDDLNKTYDYSKSHEYNASDGRIPSKPLLLISRIPMTILAILTGLLLYFLFRQGINFIFAVFWLVFYIQNNALKQILLMAMSEAPLLFFSVLSFVFVFLGHKQWAVLLETDRLNGNHNKVYLFFGLAGLSTGLAAASKIHAFILIITFGVLLFYLVYVAKNSFTRSAKGRFFIRILSLFSLSALLIFILINPFLYKNPINGIGLLFNYRIFDMGVQVHKYNVFSSMPMFHRIGVILIKLVTEFASIRGIFSTFLNTVLLCVGTIDITRRIVLSVKHRENFGLIPIAFIFFSLMAFTPLFSPLLWLRYFLFPIFVITLINTWAISIQLTYVIKFVQRWLTNHLGKPSTAV